ncbi:putative Ig domain-containing protein [Herbiconiux sp. YIM B11900]|uniref:putative Ig domain-containing protein n=1 Tax=Herbiconiux sp. YIM B11900 TaxID=3404131 RepID=UPI003F82C4A2
MRTEMKSLHTVRLSLSAGIIALLLTGMPLAVHADELTPAEPPTATADALPVDAEGSSTTEDAPAESAPAEADSVESTPAEPVPAEPAVPAEAADGDEMAAEDAPAVDAPAPAVDTPDAEAPAAGETFPEDAPAEAPAPAAELAAAVTPVVTSGALSAGTVGAAYSFQLTSNVSPVTFSVTGLPDGLQADAQSGLINGTPAIDGEFTVRLEAIGTEPSDTTQVRYDTLVIDPAPVITPVITSTAPPSGTVGVPYSFQVTSNVSPVTFSITGLPDGLTADAQSGLISGTPTTPGESTVKLQAVGSTPSSGSSQVVYATVLIEAAPVIVPVITSGPLPDGTAGVPYSFQVTSNVSPVTFSITGLPDGLTADAQTGLIQGTPTVYGEFTVRVQAISDPAGDVSQTAYYTVVIEPSTGVAPIITAGTPPAATTGESYGFRITATGDNLTYSATGLPAGLTIDAQTGFIGGTPADAGTYEVALRVVDAAGRIGTAQIALIVDPALIPAPVITTSSLPAATVGTAYRFQITATGDNLRYSARGLPLGMNIDRVSGIIMGTPTSSGQFTVLVEAEDAGGQTATKQLLLQVDPAAVPVITTNSLPDATVGTAYRFQVTATGEELEYSARGLPLGLGIDLATGLITGTPISEGMATVLLQVDDALGQAVTKQLFLQVDPAAVPVITTSSLPDATAGTGYRFQVTATGDGLEYSARGLPQGLGIDTATGLITGTPVSAGPATVLLQVDDVLGQTATKQIVMQVEPAVAPMITTGSLPDATVGVAYRFQVTATGDGLSYSARGLPRGLNIDLVSGIIMGTPMTAGPATVILQVEDALGQEATKQLILQVNAPAAPTITTSALPAARVGAVYNLLVTATGDELVYSARGLPLGLRIDSATGLITGTPTTAGSATVILQVDDAYGQTATKQLPLQVAEGAVPVITTRALPDAAVGDAYRFQVTATGSGLEYSARGLPRGLTIDASTGLITGTPTTAGSATVILQVDDALGQTAAKQLTLKVNASRPPTITSGPLPAGTVGSAYRFQVTATADGPKYSAQGLPAGLDIDPSSGLITGTPTTEGVATVLLQVDDAFGRTATKQETLRITAAGVPPLAPPVLTSAPPSDGTVGTGFSYTPIVTSATPVTFTLDGSVPGLVFDPATGSLTGTPTTAGSFRLVITATNGAPDSATQSFTLTVSPAAAPPAPPSDASPVAPVAHGPASATAAETSAGLANTGASGSSIIIEIGAGVLFLAVGIVIATKRRRESLSGRP